MCLDVIVTWENHLNLSSFDSTTTSNLTNQNCHMQMPNSLDAFLIHSTEPTTTWIKDLQAFYIFYGFLISKSIELQWAMPPMSNQNPSNISHASSSSAATSASNCAETLVQHRVWSSGAFPHRKHVVKNTWNMLLSGQESLLRSTKTTWKLSNIASQLAAASPSADFQRWNFSLLPKVLHNIWPRDNHKACLGCGLASNLFPTTSGMLRISWRGLSFHWSTMY